MDGVVGQGTLVAGRYRMLRPIASDLAGATAWDANDQILDRAVRLAILAEGRVPQAVDAARRAALVADARPGVQNLTKSTLPEVNRLVRDLRGLTTSLEGVSGRLEQGGVTGILGAPKLPDHKPGKSR